MMFDSSEFANSDSTLSDSDSIVSNSDNELFAELDIDTQAYHHSSNNGLPLDQDRFNTAHDLPDSDNGSHSHCDLSDDASQSPMPDDFPRKLTRTECQESLDQWKPNMTSWLAEDVNFEPFIAGQTWTRKLSSHPLRGLSDDPSPGKSACSKVLALNAMLSHVCNLCPVINPRTISDRTTSMDNVWQLIYLHFGCKP
jgi:hypothetical protein